MTSPTTKGGPPIDRHGRIESQHVARFERRLRFLQETKPKEQPYADRDGRWGIAEIARDAMLAVIEYESALAEARCKP